MSSVLSAASYSLDDGTGESSLGLSGGSDIFWLNQFTVASGMEVITGASIAFGANVNSDGPSDGSPITVFLWSDPNGDGSPADALVLASKAGSISSSHTDTFIEFMFDTPTLLTVGDNFFVGFESDTISSGAENYAVSRDEDSSFGRSWIIGGAVAIDPNSLASSANFGTFDSFGFGGNALIRANATADLSGVPEPVGVGVFGLCAAGFFVRKRRR